jgi:DivIVA domain-containing protein
METSDLDLPLLPSAEQIRRREFQSVRRGYDPEQVRDYLVQVAEQVETLERQLSGGDDESDLPARPAEIMASDAKDEAGDHDESESPYERVARRFAVVFETADSEAEEIVGRARDEATRVLTDARAEADRIRVDAQARAEEARQQGREALERAKQEAEDTMGELRNRRASLVSQLDGMRSTLLAVAEDLQLNAGDEQEESAAVVDSPEVEAAESPAAEPVMEQPAKVVIAGEEDDDWLFEDALDIPELEFTDPDDDTKR